jgi:hypothetical protein
MCLCAAQIAMNEEPTFPRKQHDVATLNLVERLGFNNQDLARPKCRQHAVAERREAQRPGSPENLDRQIVLAKIPR